MIEKNRETARDRWFHMGNHYPKRGEGLDSGGHDADEIVKENGRWIFSRRKIYSEPVEK
jgi:hypothetical protein